MQGLGNMRGEDSDVFLEALRLLDQGSAQAALRIADDLVSSGNERERQQGFLCRGYAFEQGGTDLAVDLEKTMQSFRQVAVSAPHALTFCNLARVSMRKAGGDGHAEALRHLKEAAALGITPEVLLGFAQYHRTKPNPDLEIAKGYYLKAALRGRFAGFFGFAEVARERGESIRARVADVLRIVLGPVLAIVLGRRAQDRF